MLTWLRELEVKGQRRGRAGGRGHMSLVANWNVTCVQACVCVRACVYISAYMYLCVHVPTHTCVFVSLHVCVHVRMSLYTYSCARLPICSLSTSLCVHMRPCVCMCVGASVSCCSAVQHLTPHIIRGIPAILGTRPRQFWENGSFWKGWECFLLW